MKDFVAYVLIINLLRHSWILLVTLYSYFFDEMIAFYFANGFISGVIVSISHFFLPILQTSIAYSLIYILHQLTSNTNSMRYIAKSRDN